MEWRTNVATFVEDIHKILRRVNAVMNLLDIGQLSVSMITFSSAFYAMVLLLP